MDLQKSHCILCPSILENRFSRKNHGNKKSLTISHEASQTHLRIKRWGRNKRPAVARRFGGRGGRLTPGFIRNISAIKTKKSLTISHEASQTHLRIELGGVIKDRQRLTLPGFILVPSALTGLTSLFGMGRGDPRRYSHLKILSIVSDELSFPGKLITTWSEERVENKIVL